MHIMTMMVKDQHIDPDLFDLFKREKIYLDYARHEFSSKEVDVPSV